MSENGKDTKEERQPQQTRPDQTPSAGSESTAPTETASSPAPEGEARAQAPNQRAMIVLVVVLFLILLAGLAGASWYGWRLVQADKTALSRISQQQQGVRADLGGRIASVHQQVSSLSDRLGQQDKRLGAKTRSTDEQVQAIGKQLATITDRLNRGDLAWHIAEVGFLLTRAQERLTVARDPRGALVALDLADQRLAALARPELMPVRSAISAVRAQIAKADHFDRIGAALRLRRAADSISDWPLKGMAKVSSPSSPSPKSTAAETTATPWYRRAWQSVRDWFGRQFTITRSDAPVKASARVPTDRETRLWLTAVREALLARDAHGVDAAIDQATQWIRGHYAIQAPAVANVLTVLGHTRHVYADRPWPSMAKVFKAWDAAGLDHPRRIAKDGLKPSSSGKQTGGGS